MTHQTATSIQLIALNLEGGQAPDWVQLTPSGPIISGRDGRGWRMTDPASVVAAFAANAKRPQIDIEHSSQLKAPKGEPAPAVGWIEELDVRGGALWGRVDWTEDGLNAVRGRAYRYLSPAFRFDPRTREVLAIVSAGLTNNPNLDMAALNAADHKETDAMLDQAILDALGLNSTATAADAVVAITKLKDARDIALNAAQTPDPEKFVPKADHQLALNRIADFERAEGDRAETAINTAVDQAIEAGKIAPASRDFYVAACRAEGGLEKFRTAMDIAPSMTAGSGLDGKKPGGAPGTLSAEELAVCHQLGMTEQDFINAKG